MLTYAYVCWRMLNADRCSVRGWGLVPPRHDACWNARQSPWYAERILTYADVWHRMLTYADVCWRMHHCSLKMHRNRLSRLARSLSLSFSLSWFKTTRLEVKKNKTKLRKSRRGTILRTFRMRVLEDFWDISGGGGKNHPQAGWHTDVGTWEVVRQLLSSESYWQEVFGPPRSLMDLMGKELSVCASQSPCEEQD